MIFPVVIVRLKYLFNVSNVLNVNPLMPCFQLILFLTTPTFYMKDRGRGTCKNKTLNEDNRCKWNKATLTNILTRQEYCGDVVNFKTSAARMQGYFENLKKA